MKKKESSRVLVIDDDDLVLTTLDKMLKAEMFSVDVSVSAREALGRLPETRYDAIIVDMWMPGMTGKDFYNQVKKEFPDYQGRIIFLTGDIASEATWDFIEEKRLPYLLKPVSQPELRRKLREVIGEGLKVPSKKGPEHRRHRRLAMKANLRVRKKRWATGGPEITVVGNASKHGVYFVTDRQYGVGTEVLVSFPYSGPGDLEQEGCVVRVDERSDGRRGVAVALGEAADEARAALELSPEERHRQAVLTLADTTAESPNRPSIVEQAPEVADLKLRLDRERKEARRLTDELADLKVSYERAASERDRLASEESDRDFRLRELTSARGATSHLVEESKQQVQDLLGQLAEVKRGQARQAKLAVGAQQETAQAADLKKELDQEREAARRSSQDLADLKAVHEGVVQERDRLVTRESGLNSQLRELASARDAASRFVVELKQQVQELQEKLATAEGEQARQAELAVGAQQEAAQVADLKKELDQEQKSARRLTQELADLKAVHEGVVQERDRLAIQDSDHNSQLRKVTSARDATSQLVEELKQQVQDLQRKLAVAEREQAQQAELAARAQQEAAQVADLKKELDQEQKSARRLTQELADLKAVHEGVVQERDRLATQDSDHNSQLRKVTSARDATSRLVEELKRQMQEFQGKLAAAEGEQARQAELAVGTRQETAKTDLKKHLDQERKKARGLTQDLADLKAVHEGAVQERDRLLTQESDLNSQLRELASTRDTMNRLMAELRKKIHSLETHVAGVEAERYQARRETGVARAETQKWRAESRRQQQEAASTERAARERPSLAKEQKGEVAKLREDLKALQARIQDFRDDGVGPLTNLAASCDLIAMKRSLDADTKKSAKELSQMAAQLRKAFQKFTRKK